MRVRSLKSKRFLRVVGLIIVLMLVVGTGVQHTNAADPPPPTSVPEFDVIDMHFPDGDIFGAYEWYSGSPEYYDTVHCQLGNVETAAGTFVSQNRDQDNDLPIPGDVYYLSILLMSIGYPCAGQYAYIDIGLPPNTTLAISPTNPLYCNFNGTIYNSEPDCPQYLPPSAINPGAYELEAPGGLWVLPWDTYYEWLIPVVSSTTVAGDLFQAALQMSDGLTTPWLIPEVQVLVYPPSTPAPGAFNKTSPTHNATVSVSPTLFWGASSNATSYQYCIDTVNNDTCDTSWVSNSTSTSAAISGLTASSTYYWQVRAVNGSGTTYANSGSWWRFYTEASSVVPDVPTVVNASNGFSTDYVYVGWASSDGATSYRVYRCATTETASCGSHIGGTSSTSYEDTHAIPGTLYYYRVTACNSAGCSDFSLDNAGFRALSPPTSVSASDGTYTDKVAVSWSSSIGATSYKVYRCSSTSTSDCGSNIGASLGTSFNDTEATPGTTYYYRVKACNSFTCSGDHSPYNTGYRAVLDDTTMADFNGDGDTDFSFYRPSNGYWYVSDDGSPSWTWFGGEGTDIIVPGDYNGDGDTDFAYYRPSNGYWYVYDDGSPSYTWWGAAPTDILVPGDYNGDGDTDFAYYRPSTGFWYVKDDGVGSWTWWGAAPTDILVPGDYNGDGDTDLAYYRPSNGFWYVMDDGVPSWEWWGAAPTDIVVPGDFNGDGDTDLAYYRPSNGFWYVKDDGSPSWEWWGAAPTDVLVPGDYNGDGDTDLAYYRPSNGFWYVKDDGTPSWSWFGALPDDVILPGDINGDGIPW